MTALFVQDIRPGDRCEIRGGLVYWQKRVLGSAPSELASARGCRVSRAGVDEYGETWLLLRDPIWA
jgi:hypothetical protein